MIPDEIKGGFFFVCEYGRDISNVEIERAYGEGRKERRNGNGKIN